MEKWQASRAIINYDTSTLAVYCNHKKHNFFIPAEDRNDFWATFRFNGKLIDVSFYQTEPSDRPIVKLYPKRQPGKEIKLMAVGSSIIFHEQREDRKAFKIKIERVTYSEANITIRAESQKEAEDIAMARPEVHRYGKPKAFHFNVK